MPSFAIIAEGPTDQNVLENVLCGFFQAEEDEPVVNFVQPPRDATKPAPGGWTLVFRSLRQGDHKKALQTNDYVVVHIDTDVSEEKGFDVSHRAADGRALTPEELIAKVQAKLVEAMDPDFCARYAGRIVFAIAVDSVECWLLPLLYEGEAVKQAKITGCSAAADEKLRRLNRRPLSKGDGKDAAIYARESQGYAKRKKLLALRGANPSLDVFVRNLEALAAPPAGEAGPLLPSSPP